MKLPDKETQEVLKKNLPYTTIIALSFVIVTVIPAMYFKIVELYEDKSKQKDERIRQLESDRDFWKDSYFNRPAIRSRDTT